MENKKNIIEKDFARFITLWNEALNGNYKNGNELGNLARKIRDAKCNDDFMISSLSEEYKTAYRYAVILANVK
mgnify:CR=1 FL=1